MLFIAPRTTAPRLPDLSAQGGYVITHFHIPYPTFETSVVAVFTLRTCLKRGQVLSFTRSASEELSWQLTNACPQQTQLVFFKPGFTLRNILVR